MYKVKEQYFVNVKTVWFPPAVLMLSQNECMRVFGICLGLSYKTIIEWTLILTMLDNYTLISFDFFNNEIKATSMYSRYPMFLQFQVLENTTPLTIIRLNLY